MVMTLVTDDSFHPGIRQEVIATRTSTVRIIDMEQNQYQVEVDVVSSSEWSQLMELFEDANIYQTWAYGAVRWGARHLSHLVLKRNNEVVAVAQLRIVGLSKLKCGIAYLRWGPLCHLRGRELDADVVQRMARALATNMWRGGSFVCEFCRTRSPGRYGRRCLELRSPSFRVNRRVTRTDTEHLFWIWLRRWTNCANDWIESGGITSVVRRRMD